MTIDHVSHTLELSGGASAGPLQGFDSVDRRDSGWDTPGRECPHDDMEIRPRIGTMRTSEDRVPSMIIESPYGRGVPSLPGDTGSLVPGKFPAAPALLADGPTHMRRRTRRTRGQGNRRQRASRQLPSERRTRRLMTMVHRSSPGRLASLRRGHHRKRRKCRRAIHRPRR